MKKITILTIAAVVLTMFGGCETAPPVQEMPTTGFLSNYSGFRRISNTSFRYVNPEYDLANYARFIVEPVELIFDQQTKAEIQNWDNLEKLRAYMRRTFIDTLEPRYTAVGTRPGPGVARIRMALTNVEKAEPFKLGGVSMELEVLDTQTNEQIAALIESEEGGVPFHGFYPWSGAKAVMDNWARRFYNRLEEARGR